MSFRKETLQRIRLILDDKGVAFGEKTMFAGVCIMVDDKMCCGTHIDRKTGEEVLLCRLGQDAAEIALERPHVLPMNFTGKPMKGYVFVTEDGFRKEEDLSAWLQLCLDFNPLAKRSRKNR